MKNSLVCEMGSDEVRVFFRWASSFSTSDSKSERNDFSSWTESKIPRSWLSNSRFFKSRRDRDVMASRKRW